MANSGLILVGGAGGFIGGHLVGELLAKGQSVRAVDIRPTQEWNQRFDKAENIVLDLRDLAACKQATKGATEVYNPA